MDRGAWWATAHGVTKEPGTTQQLNNNNKLHSLFPLESILKNRNCKGRNEKEVTTDTAMEQNTEPQNKPTYLQSIGASLVGSDAFNVGDLSLIPGSGRSPGRNSQLPTAVFSPGEFHGQQSPVGYSPWGHKETKLRYQYADFKFSKYSTFWIVY